MFAKRMETVTKKTNCQIVNSFETATACSSSQVYYSRLILQKGWALKPKRKVTRLNQNQKQFLQQCFNKGDKTGNKLTAQSVVKMMRGLTIDGKKQFCPEEYLTQEQVMSYFSRMKGKAKNLDAVRHDDNEEDELFFSVIEDNEVGCIYDKIYVLNVFKFTYFL